jgi:hypothetical protein
MPRESTLATAGDVAEQVRHRLPPGVTLISAVCAVPGNAILLNGAFRPANREIGASRNRVKENTKGEAPKDATKSSNGSRHNGSARRGRVHARFAPPCLQNLIDTAAE